MQFGYYWFWQLLYVLTWHVMSVINKDNLMINDCDDAKKVCLTTQILMTNKPFTIDILNSVIIQQLSVSLKGKICEKGRDEIDNRNRFLLV